MRRISCMFLLAMRMIGAFFSRPGRKKGKGASEEAKSALQGKKILFIGNSYTMNGFAVMHKGHDVLTQRQRSNDHGFFYQLCKSNGIDVSVTNWCFGGHDITHTFGGPCTAGKDCNGEDHAAYLTDRVFDYVAIQCYKEDAYREDLVSYLEPVTTLFRQANPDVKFILLVPHMAYDKGYLWTRDIPAAKAAGFLICNWGQMLHDICQGTAEVPGANEKYQRSSFVVSASKADGYHQNMLAGYLTALITYCAITGDSAEGQSYGFCDDPTVDPHFCLDVHKRMKYVYDPRTNFVEIFRSPRDMKGLQQMTDRYIAMYK